MNPALQKHIRSCYKALGCPPAEQPVFRIFIKNYTSHSHRKCFGRHVIELAGPQVEIALVKLSEIFSHSSIAITRQYLGLRQQELGEVYMSLDF